MQYPQNQTCAPWNSYSGCYTGCGQTLPIVPGTNPALQTWNGQNFVVADGSAQNPISLPNLQTNTNAPSYVVGATNTGHWYYYPYAVPTSVANLSGGQAGNIPWQSAPSNTSFVASGDVNQVLISGGIGSPSWVNQSAITAGSFSQPLNGDVTGNQSTNTVGKVNNLAIPQNATAVGTNASGQFVDATSFIWSIPEQINNTSSVNYTLQLSDAGKLVSFNTTGNVTITVPTQIAVPFQVGQRIDLLAFGTSFVVIQGDTGVTVNSSYGLKLRTQFSPASLIYMGSNIWVLMGDTTF